LSGDRMTVRCDYPECSFPMEAQTKPMSKPLDPETARAARANLARIAERYDLAGAVLFGSRPGAEADAEMTKVRTHSGLITAFGLRLVKTGRLPVELGRALNPALGLATRSHPTHGHKKGG